MADLSDDDFMAATPAPAMSDAEFMGQGAPKPLANAPTDTTGTSMLKGAGTAAIKGLGHIPGFAGDLRDMTDYLVQRAHSAISGVPMEELQKRRAETEAKVHAGAPSWVSAIPAPPSGADISNPALARTGEYQPTSVLGRLGMAGIEAGTSMLGPGGLMAGTRAVREGLPALQVARRALTGAPKAVPGGIVAGGAGDAATQATGDPLAGMAVGAVVPAVSGAIASRLPGSVTSPLAHYTAPIMPSSRAGLAAKALTDRARNPEAAVTALNQPREIVPGSVTKEHGPTTGEVAGDVGLLQGEKAAAIANPDFDATLKGNAGVRNQARVAHLEEATPPADVMAPSKMFQSRLAQIDADTQAAVDKATTAAAAEHAKLPPGSPPEVVGGKLRDIVAEEADKARTARKRLYDAVDPDGTLSVVTSGARTAAQTLADGIDPAVTIPSKIAAPVIEMVGKLQDVTPFNKLTDLDATISAKMAEAKQAADYTGHGQLVQMKQAVQSDIHNAIENQAKWQERAVQQGVLESEDSIGARIKRANEKFGADSGAREIWQRAEGAGPRAGGGNDAGATQQAPSVSGISGNGSEAGRGSRDSARTESLPGNEPNFDPEAAARLGAAKAAHADYAQTYRQGPVGNTLKDTGFKGQYRTPDSAVPATAFPAGDKGYEATSAFLKAANNDPGAVAAIQDMATGKLRDAMKNGELTPQALATWKKQYGNSLRAIDKASPGFSKRFDSIARATEELGNATKARETALADAQKGVAAKFIGKTDPQEVESAVGSMLGNKAEGPTQIKAMLGDLDRAAISPAEKLAVAEGLKRAGIDYMLREMANAGIESAPGSTEATRIMSNAKLRNFVDKNRSSLEALFDKPAMENIDRIVADMERQQKALDLQATKGGSDTGKNTSPMFKVLTKVAAHGSGLTAVALAAMEAYERGGLGAGASVAATYPIAMMVSKLRAHGIEKINDLYERGLLDPEVGKAMLQRGIDENGKLNTAAFNNLVRALSRSSAMNPTYQTDARVGRASGGKVAKMDYAAKAAELIKMAERAKKAHGRQTKQLLALPDQTIATALKLANHAA